MPVLLSSQASSVNNEEQNYEQQESLLSNEIPFPIVSDSKNEPMVEEKSNLFLLFIGLKLTFSGRFVKNSR